MDITMILFILAVVALSWLLTRPQTVSGAFSGVGTVFNGGDGDSNEGFTAIAEINSIDGPNMTRATIDVTSLDSTGGYREFIASFRDAGQVVLNMNFTRDGYDQMKDYYESSSSRNYQIVLTDTGATTFDFAAFVTDLGMAIPMDDKVTASVTLKITGQVTMSS
jgi:predicted secreted protein